MRTHRTRSSQGRFLMASATLARAASFSSGATESSRSRKLMSAGTVGALARNRSFDPGDDMHERRGRCGGGVGGCRGRGGRGGGGGVGGRGRAGGGPPPRRRRPDTEGGPLRNR